MSLRLSTAPTQNVGAGPHGTRITFPITGGSFEGDRLRGTKCLLRQSQSIADRQFEIEFLDAGVEAFAFTFG
jgi:hypothetical protein